MEVSTGKTIGGRRRHVYNNNISVEIRKGIRTTRLVTAMRRGYKEEEYGRGGGGREEEKNRVNSNFTNAKPSFCKTSLELAAAEELINFSSALCVVYFRFYSVSFSRAKNTMRN